MKKSILTRNYIGLMVSGLLLIIIFISSKAPDPQSDASQYVIIRAKTHGDLEQQVREHSKKGLRPVGGVCVAATEEDNGVYIFWQAMQ